jgi:hypothetical protein
MFLVVLLAMLVYSSYFPPSPTVSIYQALKEISFNIIDWDDSFSITLDNDQLYAQIFNIFITILYMYMFRAISSSPSGGQIVLTQHLVS